MIGFHTAYVYDTLSRLTSANISNGAGTHEDAFGYTYDGAGNRTSSTQGVTNPGTISYTYNAANELTGKTGNIPNGVSYTYDNNGNLTGAGTVAPPITYNAANQMTAFGSTTFGYSGPDQNQRVQVNNTNYVYSGLGCDCESNAAGSTYYTHDPKGHLIDERTTMGTYYYLFDGLGSVVGMTDSNGFLVGSETYQYDPYGQLLHQPRNPVLQTNTWRYAGGYFDTGTGLYKFGIRYYDAALGRWTQRDPVGGSLAEMNKANPYVYAGDNPINNVDPSGKDFTSCIGSAFGAVTGAIAGIGTFAGSIISAVGATSAATAASAAASAAVAGDAAAAATAASAAASAAVVTAIGAWILVGGATIGIGLVFTCATLG